MIDLLQPDEIDEVADLLADCWRRPDLRVFAFKAVAETFKSGEDPPASYTVKKEGKIVGYVQTRPTTAKSDVYAMMWLGVSKAYRGQGIGKQLMAHAEALVLQDKFRAKWNRQGGTITLVAEYKKEYYEAMGYADSGRTHDTHPIMVKTVGKDA